MRYASTSLLILVALVAGGCRHYGLLVKREAEKSCPTDIRRTVPWCAGEDAIFKCPCEPSTQFYGYRPTCWRTWPSSASAWRDMYCGNQHHEAVIMDLANQNPELIGLPPMEVAPLPPEPAVEESKEEAPPAPQASDPLPQPQSSRKPIVEPKQSPRTELEPSIELEPARRIHTVPEANETSVLTPAPEMKLELELPTEPRVQLRPEPQPLPPVEPEPQEIELQQPIKVGSREVRAIAKPTLAREQSGLPFLGPVPLPPIDEQ